MKTLYLIAIILMIVGLMIFVLTGCVSGWNFSDTKYSKQTYDINESFSGILITDETADISFEATQNGPTKIVCDESKRARYSVSVDNGTLTISKINEKKWYDYIQLFNFESPELTVYMPAGEYGALAVKANTGDVEIPEDFKFESIDVSLSTGDIECSASASETVKLKASTGDIEIEEISAVDIELKVSTGDITLENSSCENNISISVSTGKAHLDNFTCKNFSSTGNTGDIFLSNVKATESLYIERSTGDVKFTECNIGKLTVKTDTGDITFNRSDANEIFAEADTGDVTGTLLTDKIFITKTSTGKIDVPKTSSGGTCEITTSTGNIKISIAD